MATRKKGKMATELARIDKSWSGMDRDLVRAVVHRMCGVAYRDGGCRCAKAPADKPRYCDAFDGHARGIIDLVRVHGQSGDQK